MTGSTNSKDGASELNDSGAITIEETNKSSSGGSVRHLKWVTKPEDEAIIDETFWVKKQDWGTYVSVNADDLHVVTSLTRESCVAATRWYLKAQQEGFEETKTYESVVGGKL